MKKNSSADFLPHVTAVAREEPVLGTPRGSSIAD